MGLLDLLGRLVKRLRHGHGHGIDELARRLGMPASELVALEVRYREFTLPKRSGGTRRILAPDAELKTVQRRILRRLLGRLRSHPAALGFERGQSIVSNARRHVGKAVVLQMDIHDFFTATKAWRVRDFFRRVGWNRPAANLLTRLCTHDGSLPQGAPTSPRLSNLVNYRLDARLTALAARRRLYNPRTAGNIEVREIGAVYTRYADDLTFSFPSDDPALVRYVIIVVKHILRDEGYALHLHRKLHIRRRHACQQVTGLVVNERVNLPRRIRRWLRAVEHRVAQGRGATLTAAQLAGWKALRHMIDMGACD